MELFNRKYIDLEDVKDKVFFIGDQQSRHNVCVNSSKTEKKKCVYFPSHIFHYICCVIFMSTKLQFNQWSNSY